MLSGRPSCPLPLTVLPLWPHSHLELCSNAWCPLVGGHTQPPDNMCTLHGLRLEPAPLLAEVEDGLAPMSGSITWLAEPPSAASLLLFSSWAGTLPRPVVSLAPGQTAGGTMGPNTQFKQQARRGALATFPVTWPLYLSPRQSLPSPPSTVSVTRPQSLSPHRSPCHPGHPPCF